MDEATLKQLLLQARKQYIKLLEFFDLTQQLGQAVDRKDEVSVQMLLHMREDPVKDLKELEAQIHSGVLKLPEEDAIRAHQLLTGSPPRRGRGDSPVRPDSPEPQAAGPRPGTGQAHQPAHRRKAFFLQQVQDKQVNKQAKCRQEKIQTAYFAENR